MDNIKISTAINIDDTAGSPSGDSSTIAKAVVIGAGSMGSGIAAQLANAGVSVLLLDIPGQGADRAAIARAGVERQLKAGGFMHPDRAALVEVGNIEDDIGRLADADWIVEAIVEDIDLKRALYRKIENARQAGSVVSSNTSTIPLAQLVEGMGARFAGDFVITHFFNPPRVMPLLELVGGEETRPEALKKARRIAEFVMGKSVVDCRDTPGFIANRIGNYWMSVASLEAIRQGLTVEEADAVMGKPFGIPRTGIFGLFDYVGIQLVPLVWGSFMRILPSKDAHRRHDITQDAFIASMLSRGLVGRFGPGGFYRRKNSAGERVDEVIDFATGDYRPRFLAELPSIIDDLRVLCEQPDKAGRYAWTVLSHLVLYATAIAPEIAEDVASIDKAMRLGYNWRNGPFELADQVGIDWLVTKLEGGGFEIPPLLRDAQRRGGFYAPKSSALLTDGTEAPAGKAASFSIASLRKPQPVRTNASASVWDLGEGVACLEIHTKMNAYDIDVVAMVEALPDVVNAGFSAAIIGSDNQRAFSAGARLDTFIDHILSQDWTALRAFIARGQAAWLGLKYAPFPVVAAAGGLALGGGCELMMHADEIVAHSELAAGLPERKVGIMPGWGGVTQLLLRNQERYKPDDAAAAAFDTIVRSEVSGSALLARDLGLLRSTDPIVMNREHLISTAVARAKALSQRYTVPRRAKISVGGETMASQLRMSIDPKLALTATDIRIAEKLAWVLSGGGTRDDLISEEEMMALELEAILGLARYPETLARLQHMRNTNKPLVN
ncbi:3-hydroxyacyl-CoA dehydrogenase NAD-binding domain-containing protein [Agrobacterium pusense]|uniref:3-hydroxyacyl-CoA dehydrogenase NAD-binding domain-containing protein n=1 Tax=Agrobacterium pusense TaxID=648995 RepID=UPI003FD4D040